MVSAALLRVFLACFLDSILLSFILNISAFCSSKE